MKQSILKVLTCIIVFLGAVYLFSFGIDNNSTEMTAEMAAASFPLVSFESGGYYMNTLHGSSERMESEYLRDTITPLGDDRQLYLRVEKFGTNVASLRYEVRSLDSSRLIEDTEVKDFQQSEEYLTATLNIKDLIETDCEYTLVVVLTLEDGREVYYYTRIIFGTSLHLYSKLNFVMDFHRGTFDKENIGDLKLYMESNKKGDNTSLSYVDIHSSLEQLSYGDLSVREVGKPEVCLREMQPQTASFEVSFLVESTENKETVYYRVNEFYRIKYGTERCYLLEYVRTMDELPPDEEIPITENRLNIGIQNEEIQYMESSDGTIFAYVTADEVFSYNVGTGKFARIFSFRDGDTRCDFHEHHVKLLSLSDEGDVTYLVYGYMNRGRYEGRTGLWMNTYNAALNRNEENFFLPYHRSVTQLESNVNELSYANEDGAFYLYLDGTIYVLNMFDGTSSILKTDVTGQTFRTSENNEMLVWQDGEDTNNCSELILLNLATSAQRHIKAGDGNCIAPIGFMGEDLVYGVARKTDITYDRNGNATFPMYILYIRGNDGSILKTYEQEGIYVTGSSLEESQITLYRAVKEENGTFKATYNDQIVNHEAQASGTNTVVSVAVDKYETIWRINLKKTVDTKNVKTLNPKELLIEKAGDMTLPETEERSRYYVYAQGGIIGTFQKPSEAVMLADARAGVAVDSEGHYVFVRANLLAKNQIMKIKATAATETETSLDACMRVMLESLDVSHEGTFDFENYHITELLESQVPSVRGLDLTGCSLEEMLYYLNRDIPVLALYGENHYVLLTGFNKTQVVVLDPVSGTLEKKSMSDMAAVFEKAGNVFISYIPRQ